MTQLALTDYQSRSTSHLLEQLRILRHYHASAYSYTDETGPLAAPIQAIKRELRARSGDEDD